MTCCKCFGVMLVPATMNDTSLTSDTALARLHTAEAIGTLVDVMRGGPLTLPTDRIRAANSLLERAHGKPVGQAAGSGERKAVSVQLASMSDADLLEVLHNAKALRDGQVAVGGLPPEKGTLPGAVGDGSPTPNALPLQQPAMVNVQPAMVNVQPAMVNVQSADNPWD